MIRAAASQRVEPSVFGPDPQLLRLLYIMLAVDHGYLRVSWSHGTDAGVPEIDSEETAIRRLITEFDAVELRPGVRTIPDVGPELAAYDFAVQSTHPDEFVELVTRMCEDRDVLLSAASRRERAFGTCQNAAVLWCRSETKKSADLLRRFRPSPTLVFREGSTCRMTALWSLRGKPLAYDYLIRANKRLAHRLHCAKKHADAEFSFPCPGSCLRVGRSRPVPIHVAHFDPRAVYTARQVVGHLREAPSPDAWREARAA